MPVRFASFILTAGPSVRFDTNGIPSVALWSTGEFVQNPTTIAQWGLGAYARADYETARKAADWLVAHQSANGGFPYDFNLDHPDPRAYHLKAPWYSAIAQGNSISLLSRMFISTGNTVYRDAAANALKPLMMPVAQGGLQGSVNGGVWFEEYPDPNFPSHVFNGSVFALLGIHDLAVLAGNADAQRLWAEGEASLAANINAHVVWAPFKTAGLPDPWAVYDLPFNGVPEIPNYLTDFYMRVHIELMREMAARTGRPLYTTTADTLSVSLTSYLATHAPVGRLPPSTPVG
jgi:heparosan-N-sulfate-glucuronate 5-epimerase